MYRGVRERDSGRTRPIPSDFSTSTPPETASVVWDLTIGWNDQEWMETRERKSADGPLTVYEVHLGSWMRVPEEGNRSLTYRELAPKLADVRSGDELHPYGNPAR